MGCSSLNILTEVKTVVYLCHYGEEGVVNYYTSGFCIHDCSVEGIIIHNGLGISNLICNQTLPSYVVVNLITHGKYRGLDIVLIEEIFMAFEQELFFSYSVTNLTKK